MSLNATNAIKGIFAVIILYSHMRQYLDLTNTIFNNSYVAILKYIGQMMVTMYLFYSGYGLMESVKKKPNYKNSFLKKRVLKILLHFDIAVVLYIILQLLLGKQYPLQIYLGSMIGWVSVGNSTWFIFDILVLYLFYFIALCIKEWITQRNSINNSGIVVLISVSLLCVVLWLILYLTKGKPWWYNNIMVFPLGILYSLYKNKLEDLVTKRGGGYYYAFFILTISLITWREIVGIDIFGICTSLFALWVVLLSMKVKFDNKILQWLGTLAFSIYILQRLPMIVLSELGINQNALIFSLIIISSVLLIAHIYTAALKRIDKHLFK